MYSKLINEFKELKDNDYVYVIQGCTNYFVSKNPIEEQCDICGDFSWIVCEGLVKDIKRAKNLTHLEHIKEEKPIKIRKRIK